LGVSSQRFSSLRVAEWLDEQVQQLDHHFLHGLENLYAAEAHATMGRNVELEGCYAEK
jgi:hypothetical protein